MAVAEARREVPADAEGSRLDVFLLRVAPEGTTRGMIQRAIRGRKISVDEKREAKPGSIVHAGQTIRIASDAFAVAPPPRVRPDDTVPLRILHEDLHLLVIDKPAGIPVHAGLRREHPTIADALVARYPGLASVGDDPLRPGIVHRLDKDTSGVLLVARTPEMFAHLQRAFRERRVKKTYRALVRGVVGEDAGVIKLPLARSVRNPLRRTIARAGSGKSAETRFRVRERFLSHTLLDVVPVTGRTHQIRVHLAHRGFPVAGDPLYGKSAKGAATPGLSRQFLHAVSVTVPLPSGRQETFESPLPPDLRAVLDAVRRRGEHVRPRRPSRFRLRHPRAPR